MMISLEQHIEYLMMYHDCVVVPGWGAMIANHQPAAVNYGMIQHPQRTIAFNTAVSHNDGLLASSLMRRHNMSYAQACDFISDSVESFNRHVMAGNDLAFGHLGYFKLGAQQRIEFVPMQHAAACDENFGLTDIDLSKLPQEHSHETAIIAPVTVTLRERLKVAASIAAIVGIGLLLSTPVIIDKSMQTASLNVVDVKKKNTPQVTVKPISKTSDNDKKFAVIDKDGKENPVVTDNQAKESKIDEIINTDNDINLMVLTTCSSERKALKMARRYNRKGIETIIVEQDGKFQLLSVKGDNKRHKDASSHRKRSRH